MANNIIHTHLATAGVHEWKGPAIESLGEIDGRVYLSVPKESMSSVVAAEGADWRKASKDEIAALTAISPVIRQIDQDTAATIRSRYPVEEEFKALRTGDADYKAFCDAAVATGRAKKTLLGF